LQPYKEEDTLETYLVFSDAGVQFKGYKAKMILQINSLCSLPIRFVFNNVALSTHNAFQGKQHLWGTVNVRSVSTSYQSIEERDSSAIVSFDDV
jgi:hypothetical protein